MDPKSIDPKKFLAKFKPTVDLELLCKQCSQTILDFYSKYQNILLVIDYVYKADSCIKVHPPANFNDYIYIRADLFDYIPYSECIYIKENNKKRYVEKNKKQNTKEKYNVEIRGSSIICSRKIDPKRHLARFKPNLEREFTPALKLQSKVDFYKKYKNILLQIDSWYDGYVKVHPPNDPDDYILVGEHLFDYIPYSDCICIVENNKKRYLAPCKEKNTTYNHTFAKECLPYSEHIHGKMKYSKPRIEHASPSLKETFRELLIQRNDGYINAKGERSHFKLPKDVFHHKYCPTCGSETGCMCPRQVENCQHKHLELVENRNIPKELWFHQHTDPQFNYICSDCKEVVFFAKPAPKQSKEPRQIIKK